MDRQEQAARGPGLLSKSKLAPNLDLPLNNYKGPYQKMITILDNKKLCRLFEVVEKVQVKAHDPESVLHLAFPWGL